MAGEVIDIILGSQVMAPLMALDFPVVNDLIISKMERLPRGMTQSHWGWGSSREPEELPERFIIQGVLKDGGRWTIGIDLEEKVLASCDWNRLLQTDHTGSATLGVALFGLPGLILMSPLLLAAHGGYAVQRAVTGMDRHSWVVWLKLKGQLMSEDRDDVYQAFLNHSNGVEETYMQRLRDANHAKVRQKRIAMQFANRKDDICEGAFMVRYAAGCAEPGEILEDVHDWRQRMGVDQNVKLHEWLGMSEPECEAWRDQKKTIDQILEERSAGQM